MKTLALLRTLALISLQCLLLWPVAGAHAQTTAVIGGCCLPRTCQVLTEANCTKRGGSYLGDNVACRASACQAARRGEQIPTLRAAPTPLGACCVPGAAGAPYTCVVLTAERCGQRNGSFRGAGVVCTPKRCQNAGGVTVAQRTTGACCASSGTCIQLSPADCAARSGTFRGIGTTCAAVRCPTVSIAGAIGACCFPSGRCTVMGINDCRDQNGVFAGNGVSCADAICPNLNSGPSGGERGPTTGACCVGGVCQRLSRADCVAAGGVYHGDNRSCSNFQCDPGAGACCLPDGACAVLTTAACTERGGTFQGAGRLCSGTGSPNCIGGNDTGACCFGDGSCLVLTRATCFSQRQSFRGPGTTCAAAACFEPTGACCIASGSPRCERLSATACALAGGAFRGVDSACTPAACAGILPAGCACDWNRDGLLNEIDLLDYSDDFIASRGDFDGDGDTDDDDMRGFVGCLLGYTGSDGC